MQTLDALKLIDSLKRAETAHKGDNGKVLLIGGAARMAGALVLAAKASLYSGAGWTILMMFDAASAHLVSDQPELMVHDAHLMSPHEALQAIQPDVMAIGPGMGQGPLAQEWLLAALHWQGPLIIDADGLNILASKGELLNILRTRSHPTTLTPHPGEAARLLSCTAEAVQCDRAEAISKLTQLTQCHVVLKGHRSLIMSVGLDIHECMSGNAGMAVGGMGDVLTGCIAALAAQGLHHGLDLWQATCLAVELHARAADLMLQEGLGPIGMTPSELTVYLRKVLNQHLGSSPKTST